MRSKNISEATRYIRTLFAPEDAVLTQINERIASEDQPIHIGAEEGKILHVLMRMARVRTAVEIGTLGGYSTVWMARAMPENGMLYTIEKDPVRAKKAQENIDQSDVKGRIQILQGDALDVLSTLSDKAPFDMVFIDADKGNYVRYLDWAEEHVASGGLIVGDNTFLFGSVYRDGPLENVSKTSHNVMQEFNRRLAAPEKYDSIILPTEEGMTVALKR